MTLKELIEEIYLGLSAVDWGFQRKDAEEIIARIGEAYVNGLPLPGEVGRGILQKGGVDTLYNKCPEDIEFIALRKEKKNEKEK